MPTFIMLSTLTPEGVQTVKNNPQRIKEVNKEVEQIGAKVVAQWATLGQFDFINVVEAPDEKVMSKVSMELGSRGHRPLRVAASDPDRRLHRVALRRQAQVTSRRAWNPDARARHPHRLLPAPEPRDRDVVLELRAPDLHRLHGLHAGGDQVPGMRAGSPARRSSGCAQPRRARDRRCVRRRLAMGFGIVVLQGIGLFFALILGWLIGIAMGELVLWASGRYRGPETGYIAIGGCIWTYVVAVRALLRSRPR